MEFKTSEVESQRGKEGEVQDPDVAEVAPKQYTLSLWRNQWHVAEGSSGFLRHVRFRHPEGTAISASMHAVDVTWPEALSHHL